MAGDCTVTTIDYVDATFAVVAAAVATSAIAAAASMLLDRDSLGSLLDIQVSLFAQMLTNTSNKRQECEAERDKCERCSLKATEGKRRTSKNCLRCVTHPIAVHVRSNSSNEASPE